MIENIEHVQFEFEPARFPFRNSEGFHNRDVKAVQGQALASVAAKVPTDHLEVHRISREAVYGPSAARARRCIKRCPQRRTVRKARSLACCYPRLAHNEVCPGFRSNVCSNKCANWRTSAAESLRRKFPAPGCRSGTIHRRS